MRNFFASLLLTLALVPALAAEDDRGLGFWVETRIAKGGAEAVVYYDRLLTGDVGFYAQAVKDSAGYASAYAGPKIRIAEGIEVGIAIGREVLERHAPSTMVRNAWAFVDGEKYSLYATVEKGSGGKWHKAITLYKLSDTVNIGVMKEKFLGTGPRIEWSPTKGFQAWGALLRTKGNTTPMIAVNYSF